MKKSQKMSFKKGMDLNYTTIRDVDKKERKQRCQKCIYYSQCDESPHSLIKVEGGTCYGFLRRKEELCQNELGV